MSRVSTVILLTKINPMNHETHHEILIAVNHSET